MWRGSNTFLVVCMILLQGSVTNIHAQMQDSLLTLSESQYLAIIRNFHPYLQQAGLAVKQAKAVVRESRGAFDPVLGTGFERKTFDDKLYYSYFNPEITIPTWYGIELFGGAEEVLGDRVTPEKTLGQSSYLGISVPLGKDLVLDKRRAVLRQSRVILQQTRAEQRNIANDLIKEALVVYWNWVKQYQVYQLLKQLVEVNADRYRFVRIEAEQGLRAAIDTTEALSQLQQFQLLESEAGLGFLNAGLELSNFLWLDEKDVFAWSNRIIPDTAWVNKQGWISEIPALEELVTSARMEHPKLQSYRFKLDVLDIEKRLKFQSLLPKMDLKYNLINKGYNALNKVDGAFLQNNYKFGFDFQMPLFLRQGRGAYQQSLIKIRQSNLELDQVQWEIENKIRNYYNELMALRNQINIYENAYRNYQRLFGAEELRFKIGESTLFLLNSRENKMLEAQQKLLDLKTKWYKSQAGLLWAGGRLGIPAIDTE